MGKPGESLARRSVSRRRRPALAISRRNSPHRRSHKVRLKADTTSRQVRLKADPTFARRVQGDPAYLLAQP